MEVERLVALTYGIGAEEALCFVLTDEDLVLVRRNYHDHCRVLGLVIEEEDDGNHLRQVGEHQNLVAAVLLLEAYEVF